ncbi:MAG: thiamine phosphate synthase [Caulobacteraceae bacterium]|nr:thiamine phosphate synthase [Caulobacteraceae bacterium]
MSVAAFAKSFAEVLAAAPVASALARLEQGEDAKAVVPPLIEAATTRDCALIIEDDPRLAARLGADGVHVAGAGEALEAALESLKPQRIVGAGALRTRDDAMEAGEKGADYVMFGEPRRGAPAPPLAALLERVQWWAEIFETPCVAYAPTLEAVSELAQAGADFVALNDAIWAAPSPPEAAARAKALLKRGELAKAIR